MQIDTAEISSVSKLIHVLRIVDVAVRTNVSLLFGFAGESADFECSTSVLLTISQVIVFCRGFWDLATAAESDVLDSRANRIM